MNKKVKNKIILSLCKGPYKLNYIQALKFISYINYSNNCWKWKGCKNSEGYGFFGFNYKTYRAHRILYESINNCILGNNIVVCHSCDNTSCVNINHLWAGTKAANNRDRAKKKRNRNQNGKNNNMSKLEDFQVKDIRSLYEQGVYQKDIAKEYGISQRSVSLIVRKERWKHL